MRIKVQNLDGIALDWVAALARGLVLANDTDAQLFLERYNDPGCRHRLTVNASLTYPVILSIGISVLDQRHQPWVVEDKRWFATSECPYTETANGCTGATPLIAAVRCLVMMELGEEVDIPHALLPDVVCLPEEEYL